jgi:hypothetical protein
MSLGQEVFPRSCQAETGEFTGGRGNGDPAFHSGITFKLVSQVFQISLLASLD